MITALVCDASIDIGAAIATLVGDGIGGVATFIGVVRGDDDLISMTLEHYPAMTEITLSQIAGHAAVRWSLSNVTIIHRTGTMHPGDHVVFVGTSSAHRAAALESCAFLIDRLKTDAPFWKREFFADGRSGWVEPRESDDAAVARWG